MKREKVRRQIRRAAAAAAALLLAAAFSLPAGTEIMGVRLGNAIVASAAVVASGTCGTDVNWSLDSDGTLTISGSGEMNNWLSSSSDVPWYNKKNSIISVVIDYGVTSIGSNAFLRYPNLRSIDIPESVTSIGSNAFSECTSLTGITIPDSVTSIKASAFYRCTNLTSVSFGENSRLETIKNYAFEDCTSLASITIPSGVTSIELQAFAGCTNLASISFGENSQLNSIGEWVFNNCTSLTSVTIPDSVTSIGTYAFKNCTSLESIFLPKDLDVSSANIRSEAAQVRYTVDGDNVTVTEVTLGSGQTSVAIPEKIGGKDVTAIGNQAFYNCTNLTSITIPDNVTSIGTSAFYKCSSLTSINIPDNVTSIGNSAFYNCSSLTSINIPDGVASIGYNTFAYCSSLTSINIPDSVNSIGEDAFLYCKSLASITIPNNVNSIGNSAFKSCINLASITIPNSVTYIGSDAFKGCINLTSIFLPDTLNVSSAGIPDEATKIKYTVGGDKVTINEVNLGSGQTSVAIPGTIGWKAVTSIGNYAFNCCTNLTSITIPDSVTSIGNYAFNGCTNLTSITIPDSVNSIGNYAFNGCKSFTSITIPNSVTSIGDGAFIACDNLTSITIPNGVTSIGNDAFVGCRNLTSITIPDGVESIGNNAFLNCINLTSITIPDSVESIGEMAFFWCTSLESITIPDSVTSIGGGAFEGCSSLESIFLPEGLDVSNAVIPDTTTKIIYTVDADGNAAITKIDLGSNQAEFDIPEEIGEYPVISVAEEYQQYVGEHTHTGGTANCTEMGVCAICGQGYVDALGHAYGAPVFNWAEDNSCKAVFTCANDSTHVEEISCEVTITASTDAVCETGGSVTYTAKVTMGTTVYTDEKTVNVPAMGHNIVKVEETEPTCTEDGYEAHYKCSVCGKLFSDSEGRNEISAEDIVIPAKGHDFEDGVCTVCGETDPDYSEPVEPNPAEPESKPAAVVYYPVVISGNVAVDKPSAAAGDIVNVRTDFGYDVIVTDVNGRRIAKIDQKGSFTMPASKVYITVERNETLGLMSNAWSHSYVYSYDSDMNKIKVNSDSKRGVIVIDLGVEYAGCDFTVYSGRKSTKTVIISGTLDENGRFSFKADEGKNYTLVVE